MTTKIIKYDLVTAILGYGVLTHPMTQMAMLGFEIQSFVFQKERLCYRCEETGTPWAVPDYIERVYSDVKEIMVAA